MRTCAKVVLFGDTSSFHEGSQANYKGLRKLISENAEIIASIPYDYFFERCPDLLVDYQSFLAELQKSYFFQILTEADAVVVHGEGVTQYDRSFVYPYLHFSRWASENNKKSALVGFAMFEIVPFLESLKRFDYLAPRDPITTRLLRRHGLDVSTSFDNCAIQIAYRDFNENHNGRFALIRGEYQGPLLPFTEKFNADPINAAWEWNQDFNHPPRIPFFTRRRLSRKIPTKLKPLIATLRSTCDSQAISPERILKNSILQTTKKKGGNADEWVDKCSEYMAVASTSFHGCIYAFLAGVPFVAPGAHASPKLAALCEELLPKQFSRLDFTELSKPSFDLQEWRRLVLEHYGVIRNPLLERCRLNIPEFLNIA